MKRILLVILMMIHFLFSKADGGLMTLYEIVQISDFCFYGEIVDITDNNYKLRIDSSYFEEYQQKEILILDHKHKEFNHKWNYIIGEKIIVFLGKSNNFGFSFDLKNDIFLGRENEFVIQGDSLYNILNFYKEKFSIHDFIQATTDYKKHYLMYKNLFDIKFLEYRLQNQYNVPFNISSNDTILNNFYRKSKVHKFIISEIIKKYKLLLSNYQNRNTMNEQILNPYPNNLYYNQENPFLINNREGWILDSITFVPINIVLHHVKNKLLIKPLSDNNCTLFVIHNYKGVKDTLNTIYFNISKSKNITIDLKYLVCTIINYNMGSYITTIDKKKETWFLNGQILS